MGLFGIRNLASLTWTWQLQNQNHEKQRSFTGSLGLAESLADSSKSSCLTWSCHPNESPPESGNWVGMCSTISLVVTTSCSQTAYFG
ncbi:hypothetical protein AMTRI_Chr09g16700 [Amborella trichopoda]